MISLLVLQVKKWLKRSTIHSSLFVELLKGAAIIVAANVVGS
jgi:hypothetical protein